MVITKTIFKMTQFYTLQVAKLTQLTNDTVAISFDIPSELKDKFSYKPGQYLTLKLTINDKEERRAYSLCSSPYTDNYLEVAVKQVENGIVSTYINQNLKEGDKIEVMPPQGNFVLEINENASNSYVGFAAGSGITPIMSMIKSVLAKEPNSNFTLIYGNKTKNSTIFYNELKELTGDKFKLINVYSREASGNDLTDGRIDSSKATAILKENLDLLKADAFYMCGPEQMIVNVEESLKTFGVEESKIHYELFTTPVLLKKEAVKETVNFEGEATVKVIYDDEEV